MVLKSKVNSSSCGGRSLPGEERVDDLILEQNCFYFHPGQVDLIRTFESDDSLNVFGGFAAYQINRHTPCGLMC